MPTPRQLILRQKSRQLRLQLFPDISDSDIWERQSKNGFATVPRALPMIMVLMDELSPKKPVSSAYLALWCRAWDDPLLVIGSKLLETAMEAGFTGQRAQNSLCARLAILSQLGFVRFAPGPGGQYSYALLLNPYLVLKKHEKKLSKFNWNALLARMNEIGADDFTPPAPPPAPIDPVELLKVATQAPAAAATTQQVVAPRPPARKPPLPPVRRVATPAASPKRQT